MQRQVAKWAPGADFVCLSDVDVPGVKCIRLQHDWPGWWAKLEMFRPDIGSNFLYTDLDNVILGPLDDIFSVDKYTTQVGECNALAYITRDVRRHVWDWFIDDPAGWMHKFDPKHCEVKGSFGDGGFIKSVIQAEQHWEDLFPGQLANIAQLRLNTWPLRLHDIPKSTRVLLCWRPHRPWLLPQVKRLGFYDLGEAR